MNFKKIGLTALAGSLVATSVVTTAVVSAEMAVTGSASVKVRSVQKGSAGKAFSMGNQLEFAGSGEMDNGLDVKLSFVLDQNDDSTSGGAAKSVNTGTPFDSHSVSIGSDGLGTIVFHGEGGSSAQSAMDTTAAGDLWDNGYGISTANDPAASLTTNNMIFYTLPEISDGLALTTSFVPRGAGAVDPSLAYGISYTGVEGLTLNFAQGENNAVSTNTADATTVHLKYALGSVTVGYSDTEYDATGAASDKDVTSMNISYTMTEDFSVSYGRDEIARPGVSGDQDIKVSAISGSYTTGGMTIGAMVGDSENTAHGAGAAEDKEMFHLTAAFAF